MTDLLIMAIILVAVGIGIKESAKHFRGESGCCGGSSVKPVRKKLKGKVVRTYTIPIQGMHCENCVNTVTSVINDIDGAAAKVSLRKKTAKVSCDREVNIEEIKKAIQNAGYEVK